MVAVKRKSFLLERTAALFNFLPSNFVLKVGVEDLLTQINKCFISTSIYNIFGICCKKNPGQCDRKNHMMQR